MQGGNKVWITEKVCFSCFSILELLVNKLSLPYVLSLVYVSSDDITFTILVTKGEKGRQFLVSHSSLVTTSKILTGSYFLSK